MANVKGLSTDSRAAIAFKKLLGLANTSTFGRAFYNEKISSQISVFSNEIGTAEIPDDPNTAVSNDIAEQVVCEFQKLTGTGDHAWNITFPDGYENNTSNAFSSEVASIINDSSNNYTSANQIPVREVTQIVPKKFDPGPVSTGGYGYELVDSQGNDIGPTSSSRWQVDPVATILKTAEEAPDGTVINPLDLSSGTLTVYLYTGEFLKETLDNIAANAGNIEILDNGITETTNVSSIDFDTNLSVTNNSGDVTVTNDVQSTDDLIEGNNKFYTTTKVENDVKSFLTAGTQIGLNDTGSNLEINNLRSESDIQSIISSTLVAGTNVDFTDDIASNDDFIIAVQDESIEDVVNTLLVEGSNVNLNYVDSQDQLTVEVTDTVIKDTAWVDPVSGSSSTLTDASPSLINVTYDNTSQTATFEIEKDLGEYDNTENWISDITGEDTEDLNEPSGGYSSPSGIPQTYSDNGAHAYFTKDRAQDAVNQALTSSVNNLITINYTDSSNEIKLTVEKDLGEYNNTENWISGITGEDTEDLDEPNNGYSNAEGDLPDTYSDTGKHPYFTKTRVRNVIGVENTAANDLTYDSSTGEFSISKYDNFQTDLENSNTNQLDEANNATVPQTYSDDNDDHVYFTKERAQDAVDEALTGGAGIEVDYNDSIDEIVLRATGSGGTTFTAVNSADNNTYNFDKITFGVDLEVFSSGTDEVTVDFVGSGGSGGVGVSDGAGPTSYNGNLLETSNGPSLNGVPDINFNDQLEVIDDGDGTVTINSLVPTESIDTRLSSLENLLPSGADLQSFEAESGISSGKVAFDSTNPILNNSNNSRAGAISDPSVIGDSLTVGDTFVISGAKRGIVDRGYKGGQFGGQINKGESTSSTDSDTFDNATEGQLALIINGADNIGGNTNAPADVVDLTSVGQELNDPDVDLDRFANGGFPGITVSDAKPLSFPDGTAFDDNYQRKAAWRIDTDDLVPGYNRIEVRHYYSGGSQSDVNGNYDSTGEVYYVLDDDHEEYGRTMTFSGIGFGSPSPSGINTLSGVDYTEEVTSTIDFTIGNVYYYTYKGSVSVSGNNFSTNQNNYTIPDPPSGDMSNSAQFISKGITSDDFIKGGDFVITGISADDPVESGSDVQYSGSDVNMGQEYLVDGQAGQEGSDGLKNSFDQESRRINGNEDFNTDFTLNTPWDSDQSLEDTNGTPGYSNGLQSDIDTGLGQHVLRYPSFDYSSISNPPGLAPNYNSDTTGVRYYWGWWLGPGSTSNAVINLYGDGNITLVGNDVSFTSGDNVLKISISLPRVEDTGGNVVQQPTGWLDVTRGFTETQYGTSQFSSGALNGTAASNSVIDGCKNSQVGTGSTDFSSGTSLGVTLGNRSAGIDFPGSSPTRRCKIYYRIAVPQDWPGYLTEASLNWSP